MSNKPREELIFELRNRGNSYRQIANKLSMPLSTVKSILYRKAPANTAGVLCKQCGKPLVQCRTGRTRLFCSQQCRVTWWTEHPGVSSSAVSHVCPACGSVFLSSKAKFCSQECYFDYRYGRAK